jgi:flagellar assembly protein FliH
MTNTSKPATPYARFIPREELADFAAWTPDAFGAGAAPRAAEAPAPPTAEDLKAQLHAARQTGYQDGYRDGLVALDGFKHSFAQQMAAQIGALVTSFDRQFAELEQQMAQALAASAVELARQVVRSELATRPELVARVAEDAVNAVLHSARHIRVRVHPDDHLLVAQGAAEALDARGARLTASADVERGGCIVESDAGSIDARVATRWAQAAKALGHDMPYDADDDA